MMKILRFSSCSVALCLGAISSAQHLTSISVSPAITYPTANISGVVQLSAQVGTGGKFSVSLSSNNPGVTVPSTITVPGGASSATFKVTAKSGMSNIVLATITATAGSAVVTANLVVVPSPTPTGFAPGVYFGGPFGGNDGLPTGTIPGSALELVCLPNGAVELYCYSFSTTMEDAYVAIAFVTGSWGSTQFTSFPFFEGAVDSVGNLFPSHKPAYALTPPIFNSSSTQTHEGTLDVPFYGGSLSFDGSGNVTVKLTTTSLHFEASIAGMSESFGSTTAVGTYKLHKVK